MVTNTSLPFAEKKFTEVKGHLMAYLDEGESTSGRPNTFTTALTSPGDALAYLF